MSGMRRQSIFLRTRAASAFSSSSMSNAGVAPGGNCTVATSVCLEESMIVCNMTPQQSSEGVAPVSHGIRPSAASASRDQVCEWHVLSLPRRLGLSEKRCRRYACVLVEVLVLQRWDERAQCAYRRRMPIGILVPPVGFFTPWEGCMTRVHSDHL
jgi:hypothetical protein